jgi:hypothetical protein
MPFYLKIYQKFIHKILCISKCSGETIKEIFSEKIREYVSYRYRYFFSIKLYSLTFEKMIPVKI